MKKSAAKTSRNWALVIFSSLLIVMGVVLIVIAAVYYKELGWWGLFVGFIGISTTTMAILSIIRNDPSLVLLNLLLP